jgi:hypothetical protein
MLRWHRTESGYESSDGRFRVERLAGTSAGFRSDGSERFTAVGYVLLDTSTGTETFHQRLRSAKRVANDRTEA